MGEEFVEVGIVRAIYRFPVKSMQGESVPEARVHWHGLDGDRRYGFVQRGNHSGFPWLTGREVPQMVRYVPVFTHADDVARSPIQVKTPNGRILSLESADLCEELSRAFGSAVDLLKIGRGVFDSQVLSVMSLATANALSHQVGLDINFRRFRQNLILETFNNQPYQEENWLDCSLQLGNRPDAPVIRLNRHIQRCVMINIDPETAERDPRILKTVAQNRNNCVGVYASTEKVGLVRVGDVVRVWA